MIIAHRGASGVALENSHRAFQLAATDNASASDGIEFDIHTTRDGHFVVHHDPVLAGGEEIRQLTRAQINEHFLSDGSPIPMLEQVLPLAEKVDLFCEVKGLPGTSDPTLLQMLGLVPQPGRIHLHSFDHRIIARLHQAAPLGSYGALSASYPIDPVGQVRACGAQRLWQEWSLIDPDLVNTCNNAGVILVAWTVNRRDAALRLRRMGVKELCGNWPNLLRPEFG